MNIITRQEFEFAYYNVAVKHVDHYATEIPTSFHIFMDSSDGENLYKRDTQNIVCEFDSHKISLN